MSGRDLTGRVALVTGCGAQGGIGAATARCLARDGAIVIVTDRDGVAAAAVAEGISGTVSRGLDVTDRAEINAAVAAAIAEHGRLDILVNNAASLAGARPFLEITPEDWQTSFAVNLKGTADLCQAVLPGMIDQGSGVILNISSIGGLGADAGFGAYTTTKHGVIGLTKTIAAEFGPKGVRCAAICPGYIATDMHEAANHRLASEQGMAVDEMRAKRYANVALRRAGSPDEVGELAAFAASPAGGYITGVALPVTGGVPMGL